jgi:hypothetical protein
MSNDANREPELPRELPRTEPRHVPQPVGATTWVPVLAVVALLIALGMYFFGHLSMSMPNMRADTNPVTTPAPSPN